MGLVCFSLDSRPLYLVWISHPLYHHQSCVVKTPSSLYHPHQTGSADRVNDIRTLPSTYTALSHAPRHLASSVLHKSKICLAASNIEYTWEFEIKHISILTEFAVVVILGQDRAIIEDCDIRP